MTLDTTLNLPTLVTLVLAAIGAVAWLVRLEGRVADGAGRLARSEAEAEQEQRDRALALGSTNAAVALLRDQLHEFRLEVARTYTTRETIQEIKGEIVREIEKLEGQMRIEIDRVISSRPSSARAPRPPKP